MYEPFMCFSDCMEIQKKASQLLRTFFLLIYTLSFESRPHPNGLNNQN